VSARRLGIFGGSFDPPHRGHLFAARAALEAFGLDELRLVPAARPPHKPGRRLAEGRHRVALLQLLIAGEERLEVDPRELEREGPSFSVDTLREIAGEEPGAELYLVLGTDNLEGLPEWREVEALLELVRPIVVLREGAGEDPLASLVGRLSDAALQRLRSGLVTDAIFDASSTELRDDPARRAGPTLPPELEQYIREHGIYDAGEAES